MLGGKETGIMSSLTVKTNLDVTLPLELCQRYGIAPETPLRVIATRSGILLVPLKSGPPEPELAEELEQWQNLAANSWDVFPYED
jgi:bifunctional DNA-binding transcriptional regulator/antitoxin component of YhaV-PrlF toxin-antitoxin module